MKKQLCTALIICSIALPSLVYADGANLLMFPRRVVHEYRTMNSTLTVSNNGKDVGNYKVEIIDRYMDENGKIRSIKGDGPKVENSAKPFLRISPRRFSLAPGEYQNVRLLIRPKKDMPKGELRSHIKVTLMPKSTIKPSGDNSEHDDDLSVQVFASLSNVIPFFYENSKQLSFTPKIENIKLNLEGKSPELHFDVLREGKKSAYGTIEIYHHSESAPSSKLDALPGTAIYAPLRKRHYTRTIENFNKEKLREGKIEIIYKSKEDDTVLARSVHNL